MIDESHIGSPGEAVYPTLDPLEQKESQMERLRKAVLAEDESGESLMTFRDIAEISHVLCNSRQK